MTQSGMLITTDHCRFTANGKQFSLEDIAAFKNARFSEHVAECRKLGFDLFRRRRSARPNTCGSVLSSRVGRSRG